MAETASTQPLLFDIIKKTLKPIHGKLSVLGGPPMTRTIVKVAISCVCVVFLVTSCDAILPNELPSGTPLWARSAVGGDAVSNFTSVCAVSDGVVAAGFLNLGILQFGNGISANGMYNGPNMLIVKYDYNGTPQWSKYPIFSDYYSGFLTVASTVDAIYAGGWVSPHMYDLGDSVVIGTSTAGRAVIVKYSLSGRTLWARTISGPYEASLSDIAVYNNCIYVVGYLYNGSLYDFGNSVQLSGPYSDSNPFIAKFNEEGLAEWAYSIESGSKPQFSSVAVGIDGVYVAGTISGNGITNYGPGVTTTSYFSGQNPMVIKYNFDGEAQWAVTTPNGSTNNAYFKAIDVGNGGVYVAGRITGSDKFYFGGNTMVKGSNESDTCVIVKYNNEGITQWARTATSGGFYSAFHGVKYWNNSIYICGQIDGFTTFGFGNDIVVDAICASNPLIIRYDQSGIPIWSKSSIFPSDGNSMFNYIDANENGVFAAGYIYGDSLYFGNSLSLDGINEDINIALVKYKE